MADEYMIALQATIDDASISNLQTEVSNLSTKIKPIELKINTSNVESKLKNIKSQIEALSKIKINLGAGTSRNGFANIPQTTAAYKELLSIANQIDKLSLKTGGMKFNGGDIKNAEADLEKLRIRYNELYKILSSGNFGEGGFKNFKAQLSGVKTELVQLDAQLTQTQSKMVTGIKSDIANGSLGTQISNVENKYRSLNVESKEVAQNIQLLKTLMGNMDATDDIESVTTDYKQFQQILITTTNQIKTLQTTQRSANAGMSLSNARTSLNSDINVWLKNNSAAAKQFGARLRDIQSQISTADKMELTNLRSQFQDVTKQAKLAGVAGLSMGDQFKRSLQTVSSYLSAAMLISRAVMTVRNMYNEVLKVDTAMTGLKRVTNLTGEEYHKMYDDMTESAKKYGSTLSDIIDLTTSWVKLGFDSDTANKLAEITTTYQHVADLDTNTATKNLITAYKAFQTSLDEVYNGDTAKAVSYISDIFDKLNNEFALSAADVGAAMERSASALREGGNSIQGSAGLITGMTEVIQNADKTGTILQTTSLRLRGMKGQLEELGEEVDENVESISKMQTHILNLTHGKVNIFQDNGDFKSTYEILKEIASVYNQLKDTERADLLETIAGKRNANGVAAVLQNWEQVEAAVKASTNAEGTAAKENEKYMNSMQGKINATKTAWQALANTFMSSDFLKGLIDGGQTFLDVTNNIVKTIGGLPPILAIIAGYLSANKNFGIFSSFNNGALDATKNLKIFKATLEDYKTVYKSTYEENRLDGKTRIGSFFRGKKAAIGYATNGISESDIQALKDYNAQLDLGVSKQTAFYRTLSDPSVSDNARRIAENAKYGKVNIDNLAKANDALKQSYKSAAVEATLFNMAVTIGISVAVSKFMELVNWVTKLHDTYQENTEQQAEKAKQRVSNIDSELSNIKELIAKYKELASKSNLDFESKLEIKDIQNQITQLVGSQADNLDLVNGKLDEELSKLNNIYDLQEKDTTSAYRNAYGTAIRNVEAGQYGDLNWIQKIANDLSGTGDSGIFIKDTYKESTFNNTVKLINDTFKQLGVEEANATSTFNDFVLKLPDKIGDRINALDVAIKAMESQPDYQDNKIYQKLNEFRDEIYNTISDAQKAAVNLLDRLEKDKIDKNDASGINSLDDYIEYRDKLIASISNDTDVKDAIAKGLISEDTIKQRVDTYLSTLEGFSDYYQQWQSQNKSTTDSVVNQVDRFKELMDEKGTDKTPSFVEGIEKSVEQLQKLEDALVKFESGTLTDKEKISLFKAFPQLTAYADNLGTGIRNLLGEMRGDIVTQFTDKIAEFKKAGATDEEIAQLKAYEQTILNIADSVDSVKNALDSVKSVFIDLDSIIKDYNENQYFSLESLEKLSENGQRYLSYLSYENGQLKINEEAYKKLVLAQIDEIETKATLQATTDLQSLTDETAAKKYLAKVNIDLAQSQLTAAQAAFQYQLALKLAEGGNIAKAAQKVADNLNSLRNIFASARGQVDDYAAAMLGATSATEKKAKASEKAKTALESEQRALEQSKKALEDEKKALEDNKNEHEKAQKAIEDLIKWTQDYIKQIKEDEVEALEEAQKKFDESIEKQKESLQEKKQALLDTLEAEKDLHDFEKTVGEKNNDLAKKALSVAVLSLDDSSSGQKAYKEKQEEYKKSQSDLQDYLYDYSIEKRREAIEKEASIQEKHLDELQNLTDKSYERQIESIQDYLADEVRLYRDACSMIDNDNGELYGKLLSYCLTYTTTGRTEFDNMWSLAQTAMEKYNVANIGTMQFMDEIKGRIYDIDDAIDTISNNIETYENRISDVKNQLDNLKDAAVEAKNAIDAANSTPLTGDVPNTPNKTTDNSNNGMRYIGRGYDAAKGQYYYEISYRGRDYWSYVGDGSDTDRVRNLAALGITKEIAKYHNGFDTYGLSQVQHALNVDVKNIKHYATGTRSTPSTFISQEKGLEAIFAKNPNGSGSYTLTTPDSQVFDHKRTDELYDFSGDPSKYIKNNLVPLTKDELNKFGAWSNALQLLDKDIIGDSILSGMVEKIVGSVSVPPNNTTNNMATNVNITIQGDATQSTVNALRAEADNIIKRTINQIIKIPIRNKFVI